MVDDEETILLCMSKDTCTTVAEGSVSDTCADCGTAIWRKPDPGVPEDAIRVCVSCGFARMEADDAEPELHITQQNMETIKGWLRKAMRGG